MRSACEAVASALERLAVAYRDEEFLRLNSRSLDEMRVLCAGQDVELMKPLEHDPEGPLTLDHVKMACGELHANDACLKELLRRLTHKIEREKNSSSTGRVHVQCLTTLNECFKHVPSWVVRGWFKLVTTEDHRTSVELFAELCTEDLCSNLDGICASDPTLAERVTCATKCLRILQEWRVVFAHSEHSPQVGAAKARLSKAMLDARNLMCLPSSHSSKILASTNEKYGPYTCVSAEALLEQLTTGTTADKMIGLRAGQRVQVLSKATDNRSVTGTIYSTEGAHDETCLYVVADDGETHCVYATEATRPSPTTRRDA
jgi:hypothetical protein